jgi:hypothetical protein
MGRPQRAISGPDGRTYRRSSSRCVFVAVEQSKRECGFDEWKATNMSLTTLRIAMWLALIAALGCGFFMAYSLMFIAAAMLFLLIFLVLVFVVGFKDGSIARRAAWR